MAWPTRSKVLALGQQSSAGANTKYSLGGPAASHTWLIKSARCYNGDASARTIFVFLRRSGVDFPMVSQVAVPSNQLNVDPFMWVMEAGDVAYMMATAACSNLIVSLHGALLG